MKTETEKELRELDIFCAEKVMGWRIFRSGRGSTVAMADGGTDREREYIIATSHPWESSEWNPTTNPADALAVLERCIEHGYTPLLSRGFHSNEQCEMFTVRNGDLGDEYASAETLCVAACKFAKKVFSK